MVQFILNMMKYLICIAILTLSISAFGQTDKFVGLYQTKTSRPTGEILEVVLEIKADGTFYCSFYQDQLCYKDDDQGQGKWVIKGEEIWFIANEKSDVNEEFTLNFNGTKARLENDKLVFFYSKMIWPERVPLTRVL